MKSRFFCNISCPIRFIIFRPLNGFDDKEKAFLKVIAKGNLCSNLFRVVILKIIYFRKCNFLLPRLKKFLHFRKRNFLALHFSYISECLKIFSGKWKFLALKGFIKLFNIFIKTCLGETGCLRNLYYLLAAQASSLFVHPPFLNTVSQDNHGTLPLTVQYLRDLCDAMPHQWSPITSNPILT